MPPLHGNIVPGDSWPGLNVVSRRLFALGDLKSVSDMPTRYTGLIVAAIKRFQRRHGRLVNGIVNAATFAHLQASPARRIGQLGT